MHARLCTVHLFPGFHDCSVEQGSEPTAGEKREDKRNVSRYVGLIPATGSTKYLELGEFSPVASSPVAFCISCVYETCFDVACVLHFKFSHYKYSHSITP